MASRQNFVESGAQAACSSGVPWKGSKGAPGGWLLSLAANAVPQQIWNRTSAAQVLTYIVLSLKLVHGFMIAAAASRRSTGNRERPSETIGGGGDIAHKIADDLTGGKKSHAEACVPGSDGVAFCRRRLSCAGGVSSVGRPVVRLRHDRHVQRHARTNPMPCIL